MTKAHPNTVTPVAQLARIGACFICGYLPLISIPVFAQLAPVSTDEEVKCNLYLPSGAMERALGDRPPSPVCSVSTELSQTCKSVPVDNVFSICNVYSLPIGKGYVFKDDSGVTYQTLTLKSSEDSSCDPNNTGSIWRCESFAVYARIMRRSSDQKCFALVTSALLGNVLANDVSRNSINKPVSALLIPGVSRRIIFSLGSDESLLSQSASSLLRTNVKSQIAQRSGDSVGPLYLLTLESPISTSNDNLKENPARLRVVRSETDYTTISLGRKQEVVLRSILSGCQ